ncbi:MAG: hydantoinase/oxoprolinase family protein [Burkholderiaceae bacterium]
MDEDPMADHEHGALVGIDVGGTFTDLVLFEPDAQQVRLAKVPSTLENQAYGVLAALEATGIAFADVSLIVHGTTTTTNAVLERKLCRTGLITTRGFRDVLELGRRTRPQAYGMVGRFEPLIPRDLRIEVDERLLADGSVRTPLDREQVRAAIATLRAAGCESVVVHFLHAYANPEHEREAGRLVQELWPEAHLTLAHELLSESREFERGVTAAVNASVQPLLERYVRRLREELGRRGYRGDVLVVNGNGGMVSSKLVAREAAKTVMSGPASGVMAAAYTGRRAGITELITYDMGGTSSDVALIRAAEPSVSHEIEIEYGMPIHVPMVDVRTVGAGGGSIARINAGGLLEVGPQSAGADPGPVFYGRGGSEPTIADANLLLGRLDAARLSVTGDGDLRARVESVFAERIGAPLGLDAIGAAEAVIRVANAKMAGAIRMVSLSLGADPRDFALFAFGGAGPLHACALARELGVPRVLVPARPGITNALGCVVADLRHDFVNTLNVPVDGLDEAALYALIDARIAEGEALVREQPVAVQSVACRISVDMQFIGQTHLLRVPLPDARPTRAQLHDLFERAYQARFRVGLAEIRAQLVNVNVSVIGVRAPVDLSCLIDPAGRGATLADAQRGERPVHIGGRWHDTPVYWRDALPVHACFSGPAIVEQMDTTVLIEPGDRVRADDDGNLIVSLASER